MPTAEPAAVRSAPAYQLPREANRQARRRTEVGGLGAQHEKARWLSHKTPYSPTDPEARLSVKPGKARTLHSLRSLAVDTAHGVSSHVQADLADRRDRLHLPCLLAGLQRRLRTHELRLREVLADAASANGPNYALLEEQGVPAWMPVFGQYKPEIEGFTYDPTAGQYLCQTGKPLPFQQYDTNQDGGWLNLYWAAYRACQDCPLKSVCAPKARRKQPTKTSCDAAYRRAWQWPQTRRGQRLRRVRQRTVEPVLGNRLHHDGLRRLNVRGLAEAPQTTLLTALAYYLKKLLAHRPPRAQRWVIALPMPTQPAAEYWAQAA